MAWSKIVGLEVSPVTDSSAMYRFSVPLFSRSRVMLSSQMLWPRLRSNCVAFILSSLASWPVAISGSLTTVFQTFGQLRNRVRLLIPRRAFSLGQSWSGRRPFGVFRQIAQPFEGPIGQHAFRAAPVPIAFDTAWNIHPSLFLQVQQILQWSHRNRSHGRPSQIHQRRRNIATVAAWQLQVVP